MSYRTTPVEIPVEWSDEVPSKYATNMIVQHTEHEFILSFFEVHPPAVITPDDGSDPDFPTSVKAECLARIIISPSRMPEFVRVMRDNLAKYQDKFGNGEQE